MVIMRAQRPVEITVGHYYSLSLQSCELVGRWQFKYVCAVHVLEQNVEIESTKIRYASGSVAVYQKAPCYSVGPWSIQNCMSLGGELYRNSEVAPRFWKICEHVIKYLTLREIT